MKPSEAFLGVVDFFSTLVPGTIATFLLIQQKWGHLPAGWLTIERGSTEGWTVFLVFSFVLGHMITVMASALFDPLYDRVYARWRRATPRHVRVELGEQASKGDVLRHRLCHVLNKSNPDDELLLAAKSAKRDQLCSLARTAAVNADDISNTFWWATAVVRSTIPLGASEVDALSAQSKLFRSLALLLPFAAIAAGSDSLPAIVWVGALLLTLWRFMRLRWDATERLYEYFVAAAILPREWRREGSA